MKRAFRERARRAIADPFLQQALDQNAVRRMDGRVAAFATLPDPEDTRRRARQIREQTLADLETYLDAFVSALRSNGFQVHFAADATEAAAQVVRIARDLGAATVAKSKSMVSEEIELNAALAGAGIRAVETDLGEFIVQLRGETPAHIITPAVHLRTEDVAATFEQALGTPADADVEVLTSAARAALREVFLTAPVGLSGVNFGVAETGTLCIVTNEGNGRMVTTLPPVQIALMGIERLLPTLDDLAVLLQVLPRSATGQKLTSYISLIQGPRHASDAEGPAARHVILIDNGRRALAGSPLAESLLCIRCGACLNACPVYRETGGHAYGSVYSGPIGSVVSPGLFGVKEFGQLAKASTLCGACMEACPVGIDFPTLLTRVRESYVQRVRQPAGLAWGLRLYAWLAGSPVRFRWGQRLAAWGSRLLPKRAGWIRSLPPPARAWTGSRDFPPFAAVPFRARWPQIQAALGPRPAVSRVPPSLEEAEPTREPDLQPAEDPVERFQRELEAVGGEFIACSAGEVADQVAERLLLLGVHAFAAWGRGDARLSEVVAALQNKGFEARRVEVPAEAGASRARELERIDALPAGLTGAAAGLADTGTVVIPSGAGQPLTASLLPPAHFVLLPASRIHASMQDWLDAGGDALIRASANVVLVTGPSRTADIEMTLTLGVHGPGKMVVFCVGDE